MQGLEGRDLGVDREDDRIRVVENNQRSLVE